MFIMNERGLLSDSIKCGIIKIESAEYIPMIKSFCESSIQEWVIFDVSIFKEERLFFWPQSIQFILGSKMRAYFLAFK